MTRTIEIGPRIARIVVWLLILAYILLFSWLSVTRHRSFHTDAYDMGNVNQALWNTVQGRPLYFTNWRGVELSLATDSRLAMHVEPIYFLIAPVYWLWQQPESVLILQTVILALGAWPVYWLARDHLKSHLAAMIFAAAYLLFPGLQAANLWEFHAVALAAPLLLFSFYFGDRGKWALMWVFAILAMGTKEEIPLTVFLMALYFALKAVRQARAEEQRRPGLQQWLSQPGVIHGLALALVALVWFVVAVFVIIPSFEGDRSPYLSYYDDLTGEQAGAASIPITELFKQLPTLFAGRNVSYLVDLYTPVAFLSLLHPLTLIFSFPDLLINLLSDHEPMHFVQKYHYTAALIPGIIISAILGAAWLARQLARRRLHFRTLTLILSLVVLGTTLYYHYYHGYTPIARAYEPYTITEHHRLGEKIARQIPVEASVSAQRFLNPHVSGRKTLYRFPYIGDADYVFIDLTTLANEGAKYEIVRNLLEGDDFGLILAEDGYLLFQRGASSSISIEESFFDFARVPGDTPEELASWQPHYLANVTFGDTLRLIGFDVFHGRRTEMPQTPLRFALYWQAIKPISEDYQIGLYLLDERRNVIGGPVFGKEPGIVPTWYPTSQWQPGEIIKTEFTNMPWWTEQYDNYAIALGVLAGDEAWNVDSRLSPTIFDSPLLVPYRSDRSLVELISFRTDAGGMPIRQESWRASELPAKTARQQERWYQGVELLGYHFDQQRVQAGTTASVTLYWQTREMLETDYKVFVHLVGTDGALYGQHDAQPGLEGYPTSTWRVGDVIPDTHFLQIADDVPPGQYQLYVGLYDPENGNRLPRIDAGDFAILQTSLVVN